MSVRLSRSCRARCELMETKILRACATVMPGRHPSDVIRYLRIGEEMTVEQVAENLGVSMVTVRRWTPPDIVGLKHFTKEARTATFRGLKAMWQAQQDGKKNDNFVR